MNVSESAQLKSLQTRLLAAQAHRKEAEDLVEARRAELAAAQTELLRRDYAMRAISNQLAALTAEPAKIIVSEHAILRWLERKHGVNRAKIEAEMLTDRAREAVGKMRTCKVTVDGMKLVVKDGVVITAEPA